jgi:hypothetical protein
MAVTYIDPAQGALGQAFGALAEAAANRINAKKIRFKELSQNPASMEAMSRAFRAAKTPENQAKLANAYGVDLADLQQVGAAFPAGMEEQVNTGLMEGGAVDKLVKGQLGELDVSILDSAFKSQNLTEAVGINLGKFQARGDLATATTAISEGKYKGKYFDLMQDDNRMRLSFRAQDVANDLGIAQGTAQMGALETATNYVAGLDMSDPESQRYAMQFANYLANPQFAASLDRMAQWNMEMELERAKQGAALTPEDIWKNTVMIDSEYEKALTSFFGAETEEAKDMYGTKINRLNQIRNAFAAEGRVISLPNMYTIGRGSDNEIQVPLTHEPAADVYLANIGNMLNSGRTTAEVESVLTSQNARAGLNPAELAAFEAGFEQMKKFNMPDAEIMRRRANVEKNKGRKPRFGPFNQPSASTGVAPDTTNVGTGLPPALSGLAVKPSGG